MFCKYCGKELPDGTTFCISCGKDDLPDVTEENINKTKEEFCYEYTPAISEEKAEDPQRDSIASKILTFAIMGIAFGASFYLSALGLIFSIVSRVKLKKYLKLYDKTEGRATVGKHLGLAGLIVSIVFTAWILYSGAVHIFDELFNIWLDPFGLL